MSLLFLGVTDFGFMPNHAHDVCLMSRFVDGIFHGLTINRQRIVLLPPCLIPGIECPIQHVWFNTNQAVANDEFTGDDIASLLTPATEPLAGFLSQSIGPIRDGFIATHAAQRSACGDAQYNRQTMAYPMSAARVWNHRETLRQPAHLFGIEHNFGGACELKVCSVGMGQLPLRIAT